MEQAARRVSLPMSGATEDAPGRACVSSVMRPREPETAAQPAESILAAMPTIELSRGNVVRLRGTRGTTVTARTGAVWITEEESPRDVVLAAGESFTLTRSGLALVQAFRDASIRVDDGQSQRAV
jgi:hypothetical protein